MSVKDMRAHIATCMTPVVGHVVRMAGGQCAPRRHGWWLSVQGNGAGRVPHLAIRTQHAWPNNRLQAKRSVMPPSTSDRRRGPRKMIYGTREQTYGSNIR